jgi:hypothetical protein
MSEPELDDLRAVLKSGPIDVTVSDFPSGLML